MPLSLYNLRLLVLAARKRNEIIQIRFTDIFLLLHIYIVMFY